MKKKKDILDELFVNCNKLQEHKAKRILSERKDLSLKDYNWENPLDLKKVSEADINRFETFIGLGRLKNNKKEKQTKFICIAQKGELIYLEPELVKIIYNSIKEDKLMEVVK